MTHKKNTKKIQDGGKHTSHPSQMAIAQHNSKILHETEPNRRFSVPSGIDMMTSTIPITFPKFYYLVLFEPNSIYVPSSIP